MTNNFCPDRNCNRKVFFRRAVIGYVSELRQGKFTLYALKSSKPIDVFESFREAEVALITITETIFNALDHKNV